MIYLINQDWYNTSNNHAGIKYLCNKLVEMYPHSYRAISNPAVLPPAAKRPRNRILRKIQYWRAMISHRKNLQTIFNEVSSNITPDDKIILMEYMEVLYPMDTLAMKFKKALPNNKLYAMVHLVPARLDKDFKSDDKFREWLSHVDKVLTLGHSLTDYLIARGVAKDKIVTTFHYVDDYYFNNNPLKVGNPVQVIAMGSQMRNIPLLSKIVADNPEAKFVICQGFSDLSSYFSESKNVRLIPFVPENELRKLMEESDISLNVMEDTIGSNVIVTSLAMGLAMVCSDVGSIHDYCSESNTFFCLNDKPKNFTDAIQKLSSDDALLCRMKQASREKSKNLSIDNFCNSIQSICEG